jgi:glycerol uptake facilitator-like aquaporin
MQLLRSLVCELIGTAFLLATVVGSGALMHKLDAGNVAVTVMGVSIATGLVLFALINTIGSISAQFNPIVTLMTAVQRQMKWSHVAPFIAIQVLGAIVGVVTANLMFEVPALAISSDARTGYGQWVGEFVATFGLVATIIGCSHSKPDAVGSSVSAYVASAILFTSSTCFANPAVSISRIFTTTITGIRPIDVPAFIACELAGAIAAFVLFSWLFKQEKPTIADSITIPDSFDAAKYSKENDFVGITR